MFIAHYKSVSSSDEFYSEKRDALDFPTQVEYNSERYSLIRTIQVFTSAQEKRVLETANNYGIKCGVRVD